MSRFFVPLARFLSIAWAVLPAQAASVLTLPARPGACVEWAARRLETAVHARGGAVAVERAELGLPPESFAIDPQGDRLLVRGQDAVGEMYGIFELAEALESAPAPVTWGEFVAQYRPQRQSPYLEVRADNPFVHIDRKGVAWWLQKTGALSPSRLFEDRAMWERYIDQLAQCRFNVMDLHGIYNEAGTTFHNLLPYLVTVKEYPKVGSAANQRQNMADLRHLLSYAHDRGVQVTLMNYSSRVDGLKESARRDYTQKAVAQLLKKLHRLEWLGFRIGESGERAAFFEETYLRGVRDSGRTDARLYTRSWKVTPQELAALAAGAPGRMRVEIKYNGEHLGLPYQAIQGPRNIDYSYAHVLDAGAPYDALWQVRANGTMRFWTWADSAFIRRAVGSFRFGGAKGFSLEPESAYFDTEAAGWYRRAEDRSVYRYTWQKNWPWYLAWGRLSYNPELSDQVLRATYAAHFPGAAAEVYAALQASGPIVPLALAYRFTGPDQRNMSPETQTAAFDTANKAPVTPLSFAINTPMDQRSFIGIDEYVERKIAGEHDSRVGPPRIAEVMARQAAATRAAVAAAEAKLAGNAEWRLLKTDLLATGFLGEYYAARIRGTMHLDYAMRTGSAADYALALPLLEESRAAWAKLAQTTDPVYAPIQNPLIGQMDFTWASEVARLEKLDATIPKLWSDRGAVGSAAALAIGPSEISGKLSVRIESVTAKALPDGYFEVSCAALPGTAARKLTVWSKGFPSDLKWVSTPMIAGEGGRYVARVPGHPEGILYLIAAEDAEGGAAQFPSPLEETPFWVAGRGEPR